MHPSYLCPRCGWSAPESPLVWRCPACGSPLELNYEASSDLPSPSELLKCRRGVWCFARQLPSFGFEPTLGEGLTPLREAELWGFKALLKLESANPTGSFKDRGAAVAVASLLKAGLKELCEDSSGNAGISIACYARAHGLRAVVAVPSTAPKGKLELLKLCGAEVVFGSDREDARRRALDLWKSGVPYVPHTYMPHYVEGMKTIAYEVYLQLGEVPSHVFVPTASGTALLGLYKGFSELKKWGYASFVPKLVAVQAAAAAPLYKALYGRDPPVSESETVADGIAVKSPPRLEQMVKAVEEAKGSVVAVANADVVEACRELLRAGVLAEPTSAAAAAGLKAYAESTGEAPEKPLVVVTGSGLKLAARLLELLGSAPTSRRA